MTNIWKTRRPRTNGWKRTSVRTWSCWVCRGRRRSRSWENTSSRSERCWWLRWRKTSSRASPKGSDSSDSPTTNLKWESWLRGTWSTVGGVMSKFQTPRWGFWAKQPMLLRVPYFLLCIKNDIWKNMQFPGKKINAGKSLFFSLRLILVNGFFFKNGLFSSKTLLILKKGNKLN